VDVGDFLFSGVRFELIFFVCTISGDFFDWQ
jgi:hypothetical protein